MRRIWPPCAIDSAPGRALNRASRCPRWLAARIRRSPSATGRRHLRATAGRSEPLQCTAAKTASSGWLKASMALLDDSSQMTPPCAEPNGPEQLSLFVQETRVVIAEPLHELRFGFDAAREQHLARRGLRWRDDPGAGCSALDCGEFLDVRGRTAVSGLDRSSSRAHSHQCIGELRRTLKTTGPDRDPCSREPCVEAVWYEGHATRSEWAWSTPQLRVRRRSRRERAHPGQTFERNDGQPTTDPHGSPPRRLESARAPCTGASRARRSARSTPRRSRARQ